MIKRILLSAACAVSFTVLAAEDWSVSSPDGKIIAKISDEGGLRYRIEVDGKPLLNASRLGLEFAEGLTLGPAAKIEKAKASRHDGTWENHFGKRRTVRDQWNQIELTLQESGRRYAVIFRVYDDGVAFRYDLPKASKLGKFVLNRELTEFAFAGDHRCWAGESSDCAENQYPAGKISSIPQSEKTKAGKTEPYKSVLPLLVETPLANVAVSESDLRDWAGMFLTGTGSSKVGVTLAPRGDGRGCVVSEVPRVSPWRVLMIGRTAGDLVNSDLIANLATPSQISNTKWIKPGVSAWDPWWTGLNKNLPQYQGVYSRGDTQANKEFVDFAAEMGWSYQLVDWMWYVNCTSYNILLNLDGKNPPCPPVDFAKTSPEMDVPALLAHAKSKNIRLIMWLHSYDIERYGIEKACQLFSSWGVAGLKIDFMNNDNQETVAWYEKVISTAARYKLLIDFHGAYKATGLNRTYPNYITQEGVLGNEYNKFSEKCTPLHTVTLPFTRGLLGPMDFTPGGFIHRTVAQFDQKSLPAVVMGTRARQLAMPVIYLSPLTVFCDSPANYRGAAGIEFYRSLPTVWDETVVLSAEIAGHVVIARRSGDRWWLAAMNGGEALKIRVPLKFLGAGKWTLRSFADAPESATKPETVKENFQSVTATETLELSLAPAGGYAALLSSAATGNVLLETEQFADFGGWVLDQQFMDQMGSPFLLAHGLGEPVRDAVTTVTFPAAGEYRVWVRTRDWVAPWKAPGAPGKFKLLINGKPLATTFGTEGADWHWQDGGTVKVKGTAEIALHDLTGFEGRCDAVLFCPDTQFQPPNELAALTKFRRETLGFPESPEAGGNYDLVVVGGGIAGTAAAVSAARLGLTVALVQDRPVLGGNGSSEVRVWPEGHLNQKPFPRIGDVVGELMIEKPYKVSNAKEAAIYTDERKLAVVQAEPKITLLTEHRVNGVEARDGVIRSVVAQHTRTGKRVRLTARWFADCTGDAAVGFLAGADSEMTREDHMGASNLWNVREAEAKELLKCECKDTNALNHTVHLTKAAAPFPRCPWAVDLSDKPFPGRTNYAGKHGKGLSALGGWFWESGFKRDPIAEVEWMRDQNFRAMYGAWDTLKNVDKLYPNHKLGWAAFIAGKRESRRLLGDVVLAGDDFRTNRVWVDGSFPCSWSIDLHLPDPGSQKGHEGEEFISEATVGQKGYTYKGPYWAPYRCLYSRNISNLFMAGRDISVSHEALGATRVMRTCGMMGEVVGMAAAVCKEQDTSPRGVYEQHLDKLKKLMERGVGKSTAQEHP